MYIGRPAYLGKGARKTHRKSVFFRMSFIDGPHIYLHDFHRYYWRQRRKYVVIILRKQTLIPANCLGEKFL